MVDWGAGSYETTSGIELAPAADVVVSVFGVIFSTETDAALREIRRVLRPGGRALISAWVPDGPIDAMLAAIGPIIGRVVGSRLGAGFAWHDPAVLGPAAAEAGLALETTTTHRLPIGAAYVDLNQQHPMAAAVLPAIRRAGADGEVRAAQLSVLRAANEDPDGFLVHSPYVVHRLGAPSARADA